MKLNHECVRDVLLDLEEKLSMGRNGMPDPIKVRQLKGKGRIVEYTNDDIDYSLRQLVDANYIKIFDSGASTQSWQIVEITWNGHNYLDTIRDNTVWKVAKEKASVLSGVGIAVMTELVIAVAKAKLGLIV